MDNVEAMISIIVPVYNVELYLRKCIDSIIKQTYKNIQIILIDDGSTDDSGKICDEYIKQDTRIQVYHTLNRGSVAARRLGINVSNGKYIGFVDADDYIEPDTFLELLNDIERNNADFVHFGFVEENNREVDIFCGFEAVFELENKYDRIDFLCSHVFELMDITPSIWSKLFKADFIKKCYKNLSDTQQYGEDLLCLCYCILEADRISLSKKAFYHYVVRKNSLSHFSNYKECLIKEVELWSHVLNILKKYDCEDKIQNSFYEYLKGRIVSITELIDKNKIHMPRYYSMELKRIYGKRIVIYGAGNVGRDYFTQIRLYNKNEIVAWVDIQWYKYDFEYFDVTNIEEINNLEFDIIIIAIENEEVAKEIKETLINKGFPIGKIKWMKPNSYY